MATVARPTELGSADGVADASDTDFSPSADESWEVHSVSVTGSADVKVLSDTNDDGTFEIGPITIASIPGEDQLHAVKIEIDGGASSRTNNPLQKLRVTNTSGGTIDIVVNGVVIT